MPYQVSSTVASSSSSLQDNPLALAATVVFWLAVGGLFFAYKRQKRREKGKVAAGLAAEAQTQRQMSTGAATPNTPKTPPQGPADQSSISLIDAVPLNAEEQAALAKSLRSDAHLLGIPSVVIAIGLLGFAIANRNDGPLMGLLIFMTLVFGGAAAYFLGFGISRSRELPPRAYRGIALITEVSRIGTNAGFPATIVYCIGGVVIKKRTQFQRGFLKRAAARGWTVPVTIDSANPQYYIISEDLI